MNLYPKTRHPYYLVSPQYTRRSAGIRALYLLCHHLNLKGYPTYIILYPPAEIGSTGDNEFDLLTPLLKKSILKRHLELEQYPITIYPESILGNPFSSPCVVRYYLNFPELLGGGPVSHDEFNYGYSRVLAEAVDAPDNVLFIPTIDTTIFHPSVAKQERKGSCFYAAKYKDIHNGELFAITKNSLEIRRDKGSQSPKEIAHLFRTRELFYVYENTMLATEAILCGCPTVMLPNPYMSKSISSAELGTHGLAWGTSPEELRRARETVHEAWTSYKNCANIFHKQLSLFVDKTQNYADEIYQE